MHVALNLVTLPQIKFTKQVPETCSDLVSCIGNTVRYKILVGENFGELASIHLSNIY